MADCTPECSAKLADLEARLRRLEEAEHKHVEFRREYYNDRESRIRRDAQLDGKITGMDEKLDKLLSWQEAQQKKPGKLIDGLVEKLIWAVLAAFIGFVFGQIGL